MPWLDDLISRFGARTLSRGAGISRYSATRIKAGTITPSGATRRSLRNLYERSQYNRLREAGMSATEARIYRRKGPEAVNTYLEQLHFYASRIEEAKGADMGWVMWGMGQSSKVFEDWEKYTSRLEYEIYLEERKVPLASDIAAGRR